MFQTLILLIVLLLPVAGVAEPLPVFVSVLPLKTFVEKVGGEHVEVSVMVLPGHNPASYDPTPRQIAALARAMLYVGVGVPFEKAWMERIRSANPELRILDAGAGIGQDSFAHHHEGDSANHPDPHLWTSPPAVKQIAAAIRDALTELDPAHGEQFARNYRSYAAELDALDGEIRSLLEGVSGRTFMVFHPAWGDFANTYGLTQLSIEKEGKEPGAHSLAALIEQARAERVKVIFVQPQFDRKAARQVAAAIGARVVAIDPLSADYIQNLRRVAQQIAEALQP